MDNLLDSLMAEAIAHKSGGKVVAKPDESGAFSLDDLLAEAVELKATKEKVKSSKKALKTSLLNRKEREELQGYVDDWESRTNWRDVAFVAMFRTHECKNCENLHSVFQGFFIQQVSKTDKTATRWIPACDRQPGNLPRRRKEVYAYEDFCWECIEETWLNENTQGYVATDDDLDHAERIKNDDSLLPSERAAALAALASKPTTEPTRNIAGFNKAAEDEADEVLGDGQDDDEEDSEDSEDSEDYEYDETDSYDFDNEGDDNE